MKKNLKSFLGLLIVILMAIVGFLILNFLTAEVPAQEIEIEEKADLPGPLDITSHEEEHKLDKQLEGVEGKKYKDHPDRVAADK